MKKEKFNLQEAAEFVLNITPEKGTSYKSYITLKDNMMSYTNGIVSAGFPIETDINCNPHADTFLKAIKVAGDTLMLTQPSHDKLVIKRGRLNVSMPCVPNASVAIVQPDPKIGDLNSAFGIALDLLRPIIKEQNDRLLLQSVCVSSEHAVATNGKEMLMILHANKFPHDFVLPYDFIPVVNKIKEKIVGFGLSKASFTIHYENGAWLRTQCYNLTPPAWKHITERGYSYKPIARDFFDGVAAVMPFAKKNRLWIGEGRISNSQTDDVSYAMPGLDFAPRITVNADMFERFGPWITDIDFCGKDGITSFKAGFVWEGVGLGYLMQISPFEA